MDETLDTSNETTHPDANPSSFPGIRKKNDVLQCKHSTHVGSKVGEPDGDLLGSAVGASEGAFVGLALGLRVGFLVGDGVGLIEGDLLGFVVG
mmetsp:Transcript_27655/g.50370  ORF Transcript_27655/g.50370 Transcript_27655/m.50370 type:complete len:93 (-) Transcript_27655:1122-1400(-)